ncbi:MAG: GNAT family N-acetyltransferase [Candidatus Aenigmatarchaeota archaeon]
MKIRRFRKKDAEFLAGLSEIASKELKQDKETSKDFLKIFNRDKNLIWIAEDNMEIVGYLYGDIVFKKGILNSGKMIELAMVYVVKKYRNKGVATKLTKAFLRSWKKTRYKAVISYALNEVSTSLLKDTGFKQRAHVYYLEKKL